MSVSSGAGGLLANAQTKVLVRRAELALEASGQPFAYAGAAAAYKFRITNTGTLAIYTPADIAIAGNGIVNGDKDASTVANKLSTANQPKAMQIYGTNTSVAGQSISISGNGVLSAIDPTCR